MMLSLITLIIAASHFLSSAKLDKISKIAVKYVEIKLDSSFGFLHLWSFL